MFEKYWSCGDTEKVQLQENTVEVRGRSIPWLDKYQICNFFPSSIYRYWAGGLNHSIPSSSPSSQGTEKCKFLRHLIDSTDNKWEPSVTCLKGSFVLWSLRAKDKKDLRNNFIMIDGGSCRLWDYRRDIFFLFDVTRRHLVTEESVKSRHLFSSEKEHLFCSSHSIFKSKCPGPPSSTTAVTIMVILKYLQAQLGK